MISKRTTSLWIFRAMTCGALCLFSLRADAVVAPSTFTNAIQVQGETAGTEFDDWAGIPVAISDLADNPNGWLDFNEIQIANDNDNIYIRVTLHNPNAIPMQNLHLAFDTDQDDSTGYDLFGLGLVGSELGYQTDFPFQQSTEEFNTGIEGITDFGGDIFGHALTFPFWDGLIAPTGTEMEWAIPRSLAFGPDAPGDPVFTQDTFDFIVWTEDGDGDIPDEKITYTLAADPNPGTPGDFDEDEDVDGADFLLWQRNQAIGDLADWQNNYGAQPLAGQSSLSVVPEPSSLLLMSAGLLASLATRRRS